MRRYALCDDQWDRIKDILPGREGHVGGTAADNRLFIEAVLFRFRAGVPWRDLASNSHFEIAGFFLAWVYRAEPISDSSSV